MDEDDTELRTARLSVSLTPAQLARLDAYAQQNHWTRSTAVAVLIDRGLPAGNEES